MNPLLWGFLWALPGIGAALHAVPIGPVATFYFNTAGLITILAVMKTA